MSRIAKKPVQIDKTVKIDQSDKFYIVCGKLGKLSVLKQSGIDIIVDLETISLSYDTNEKLSARAGLLRSMLQNAVVGVTQGYKKKLLLKGLGYRAAIDGKSLSLSLGFSHKVLHPFSDQVKISLEKDTIIHIEGLDKATVHQEAAVIRQYKKPDNYHAKGILYDDEVVITKEGKKK